MGRQWNAIIDALSGGTMSINANLTDIESLLTTLQADVADGISISSVPVGTLSTTTTFTSATSAQMLASNSSRKIATIFNSTPNVLYVLFGNGNASSSNFTLALGEKEFASISNITTQIKGIYSTSGTAFVTEVT